ncbi:phosphotransferase enzyme family protein [Aspergillus costaricaensis CBS 115574]|uniref:Phosphotransferase enzyme family protein n=1 Tax=Aspergillus costaricaensis CBS 115574 TaxID=1448317 RepID=A0ACD1I7G8_9EURO|nr:phosphotransferase enzyme family protein [Aspergillus costaricaensis CBS 115574]RAK86262.1 phosphotransferase enzyme family protein [Aspergillus costaricaensis CBS 115574]
MDDGFEVIAKIPYRFTAATLCFLHAKGIPVPRLYGYSSSEDNPVGAEYILMEKAMGVGLQNKWHGMSKRDRHKLASSFVEIEGKFFNIPFGSIGSLYFKTDIKQDHQTALYAPDVTHNEDSQVFCISPTADYMFWYGRRAALNINRGPWNNHKEYLACIARKEAEWIRCFGKPVELDFPYNGVFPGLKYPADYLPLLDKYLALVPFLLPEDTNSRLNKLTLRHPGMNPNNILILPESGTVSSEADELYRRRLLFYHYHIFNGHYNKPHLEASRDPILLPWQHLVDTAGRQWSGNLVTLKGALVRMVEYWPHLPDTEGKHYPVKFSAEELNDFHDEEQTWLNLKKVVSQWYDQVGGVSEEGWVSNERYDETVQRVAELQSALIASAEGDEEDIRLLEEGWLFRDRDEVY